MITIMVPYHSKVGKAVAAVEANTIAWLALPARLLIRIFIEEEDYDGEDDEEDGDDGEDDHDHDHLVTDKVFAGLHTFLAVRAPAVWTAKLLRSCQQIFLTFLHILMFAKTY